METAAQIQRGLATVKFTIDTGASRFTVQAFATGLLSSFGHNPKIAIRDYDGEIEFVPETFEKASVRVTVRTGGMEVLDEMKRRRPGETRTGDVRQSSGCKSFSDRGL